MSDDIRKQTTMRAVMGGSENDPPMRGLSCRVYMHYGSIDIEFGVNTFEKPGDESDQQRLWYKLYREVMSMHDEWALNVLPNLKMPTKTTSPNQDEEITVDAHSIIRDERDRKRFRLLTAPGTNYGKYGVPIFAEIARQYQLEKLMDGINEMPIPGRKALVIKRGSTVSVQRIWKDETNANT